VDVLLDSSVAELRPHFVREGIRSLIFVPLAVDAGVIGKFMLYFPEPHEPSLEEMEIARIIAAHVALATEHKRAELARFRSEQRLQAILDNSPAIVFLKDVEGRYLLVNRRWEELFNETKADVIGKTDFDLFPKESAEQFVRNDNAVLAARAPVSIEEQALLDDGPHSYISVKFPLEESDGRLVGVCGISTDITERKRLESASQRLAAIVESSDDAIVGKDLNGIITSWNAGAERIFGYTAAEAVGRPISMLAAPDRLDEMPTILSHIHQGLRFGHYETRRRRKDGRVIDVALTVSPVCDAAGQIIGASKIARDISEWKRAEQERIELQAREREAHRTAELLNQVAPRIAAQLNLEKLLQEVTDVATTLVGAAFGAFFHNVVDENGEVYLLYTLSGVPREAFANFPMPRSTELFGPTFRGEGIVRSDDVMLDPRYGKNAPHHGMPQGHLPVRSYLAAPVVSRSGEVLGGLFFGHPETGKFTKEHEAIVGGVAAQAAIAIDNARLFEQAQRVQSALERSNEELRRANRDLEIFAYSASHDLQEPLRNIAISAQLIERRFGQQIQGEDAEIFADILGSAKRMSHLVGDLLTYTKATTHEEGPPPIVSAGEILAEVLQSLRAPIDESGAQVTAGELPMVAIHPARLAQLFQNLLSNAIKYRGKDAPRVHVTAEDRDGWCVISVTDNGIGVEAKYAEQIFGLFKRLHARDEFPGSGIGLAICQRVVEQYGGRVWLEKSEPGKGSTFAFSIPAHRGTAR
jgi:PAS domain S-box-containing protein